MFLSFLVSVYYVLSQASTGPVLVNRGVVPVVCGVLYRQPFVETLQAMGLMLLFNLACSVKFRIDIVLSGSAELAVNAIRRMAKNEKVVMAAVKLLANLCHECKFSRHAKCSRLVQWFVFRSY